MSAEESKFIDNKMLELEFDKKHPEELEKEKQEEEKIISEYDDNMVTIEGLFVENKLENMIINEAEISDFTCLSKSSISQNQIIPYKYDPEFLILASQDLFDHVEITKGSLEDLENDIYMNIEGVDVHYIRKAETLKLTWNTSPKLDLITDAIGLLAIQLCKLRSFYHF